MNKIKVKHGGNIVSRESNNDISSMQSNTGSQNSNVRRGPHGYRDGHNLPEKKFDEAAWKPFYRAVSSLAWANIGQPIDSIVGCDQSHPDKPGYMRGWIFNGIVPSFAPCGCYRDAIWPHFLGLELVAKTIVNTVIIKRLRRTALQQFLYKSSTLTLGVENTRKMWLAIKKLGVQPGNIRIGNAVRTIDLPPVPPGHTRLFRAQGNNNLAQKAVDSDPQGTARWFTDDATNSVGYISSEFVPGAEGSWVGKYPNGHLVYTDVPTSTVDNFKIGDFRPNVGHQFLPQVPPSAIDGESLSSYNRRIQEWADVNNIEVRRSTITNQKTGQIYYAAPQDFHYSLDTDIVGSTPQGVQYKIPRPTVLRTGDGKLVLDIPGPNYIRDNPKIFAANNRSGSREFFVSADIANRAKKIAGVKNLADVKEFDDIMTRIQNYSYFKDEDGKIYAPYWVEPKDYNDDGFGWLQANPPTPMMKRQYQEAEKFLKNSSLRSQKIQEWDDILDELKRLQETHLDALPDDLQAVINEAESLLKPDSPVVKFWDDFSYLLVFIGSIMSVTSVVEDRKCGPKAYQYSLIKDTARQIGIDLTPGYTSPVIPRISERQWDLIRNKLIQDEARVLWAELDDNCDCNDCPEDYNLCDSTINFFTDYYNQCLKCQECKNSNEFDPIYAENSKVPIVLSHKSSQIYRSTPLIAVDGDGPGRDTIIDARDCVCECPNSTVVRLDKNGLPSQLIPSRRALKEYTPQTGNIFEDYNCFGYSDGDKKIDIDIEASPGGSIVSSLGVKIPPSVGRYIPGIPFETEVEGKVCDYEIAPDGLYESSIFPWQRSVYYWSPFLGRWSCKETKECESPQIFTEGVGDNNQYCDCYTLDPTPTPTPTVTPTPTEDPYSATNIVTFIP